jgi:hypothetical protein
MTAPGQRGASAGAANAASTTSCDATGSTPVGGRLRGEVDREIEDVERTAAARRRTVSWRPPGAPTPTTTGGRVRGAVDREAVTAGSDLSALAAARGGFVRGAATDSDRGRRDSARSPYGLTSIPGASPSGGHARWPPPGAWSWVARDAGSATGWPRLGAWLGDADAVACSAASSLATKKRARLDETAARGCAGRLAVRSGADPRRQRPGPPPADARPADLPSTPRILDRRPGLDSTPSSKLLDLGYRDARVADRAEFARRRDRRRVPAEVAAGPDRLRRQIDTLRRFDPTDQRTVGSSPAPRSCRRASSSLSGGVVTLRLAAPPPARAAAATWPHRGPDRDAARAAGDPAERATRARRRRRGRGGPDRLPGHPSITSTGNNSSSTGRTLAGWIVLGRRTAGRPDRRGDLPRTRRRPPRATDRGCSPRNIELGWSARRGHRGSGLNSGDLFDGESRACPGLRSGRLVEAVESWADDGVDRLTRLEQRL